MPDMYAAVNRLAEEVGANNAKIERLTEELGNAVGRNQLRRVVAVCTITFLLAVWAAITLHDEHVAHCYPPPTEGRERICNTTFPFHDHPRGPDAVPNP